MFLKHESAIYNLDHVAKILILGDAIYLNFVDLPARPPITSADVSSADAATAANSRATSQTVLKFKSEKEANEVFRGLTNRLQAEKTLFDSATFMDHQK